MLEDLKSKLGDAWSDAAHWKKQFDKWFKQFQGEVDSRAMLIEKARDKAADEYVEQMNPYLKKNHKHGWDSLAFRVKEVFPEVDLGKIPYEYAEPPVSEDEDDENGNNIEDGEISPEADDAEVTTEEGVTEEAAIVNEQPSASETETHSSAEDRQTETPPPSSEDPLVTEAQLILSQFL